MSALMRFMTLAALCAAAALAEPAEPIAQAIPHVVDADGPEAVQDLLGEKNDYKALLLVIYAPWCEHSNALAKVLEDVALIVDKKRISRAAVTLAKVDGYFHSNLAEMFRMQEFPAIVFSRGDQRFKPYRGGHSVAEVIDFLNRELGLRMTLSVDGEREGEEL